MIPVILSGGSGERLWPLSRKNFPKPFLQLFDQSLFEQTLARLPEVSDLLVVAAETQKVFVNKSLKKEGRALRRAHSLFEPMGRNTAPAVALACQYLLEEGFGDDIIAILPADHFIEDEVGFLQALSAAEKLALDGKVVTLGIEPTGPATGFGYIKTTGSAIGTPSPVEAFIEKPDLVKATAYLKEGGYFWNAGIFVSKVSTLVAHFQKYQPSLWGEISSTSEFSMQCLAKIYEGLESISFDVAIMEKLPAGEVMCIPVDVGWSDLGSWDAVADRECIKPDPKAVMVEASNVFVKGQRDRTYALLGVKDLIVVDTPDALLIANRDRLDLMKDLVTKLKATNPKILEDHTFEERPWGSFEVLKKDGGSKCKMLFVQPGQQLSYQSHQHSEEHWIVTRGEGEVVLDEKIIPVHCGTYIHIPVRAKHRIRNTGDTVLEFIEVQIGEYFGEDDITRYQDDYSRS